MWISYQAFNLILSSFYLVIYVLAMSKLFINYGPKYFDLLINTTIFLYLIYFSLDFAADISYLISYNQKHKMDKDFISDSQSRKCFTNWISISVYSAILTLFLY